MTVTAATPALARPRLDIGLAFKKGWDAFTADIVPFLVGTLIAGLLSIVTLGILAGPLAAGLYTMAVRRMRDGRQAAIGDVFSCFDRFWSYLWAAIVLVVLIGLASLTIVGGILLATIWIYVFPFMVDRRMGLGQAMSASYHRVVDNGFWEHLALIVVFFAVSATTTTASTWSSRRRPCRLRPPCPPRRRCRPCRPSRPPRPRRTRTRPRPSRRTRSTPTAGRTRRSRRRDAPIPVTPGSQTDPAEARRPRRVCLRTPWVETARPAGREKQRCRVGLQAR